MTPESKEITHDKSPWIIFDFDGVLGRYPGYFYPDYDQMSKLIHELEKFVNNGYRLGLLTNRSVGELQPVVSFLGISGWIIGENGAVALNADDPKFSLIINTKYRDYSRQTRPELLRRLENSELVANPDYQGNEYPFRLHPANFFVKIVLLPTQDLKEEYLALAIENLRRVIGAELLNEISIKVGKGVDIDPANLSKSEGMRYFLELNEVDPSKSIFIADAPRDIPAAEILVNHGGYFGIVGNADQEVIKFAQQTERAIITGSNDVYHGAVGKILYQFRQKVL